MSYAQISSTHKMSQAARLKGLATVQNIVDHILNAQLDRHSCVFHYVATGREVIAVKRTRLIDMAVCTQGAGTCKSSHFFCSITLELRKIRQAITETQTSHSPYVRYDKQTPRLEPVQESKALHINPACWNRDWYAKTMTSARAAPPAIDHSIAKTPELFSETLFGKWKT